MNWIKILMMILSYGAKQRDYKETASKGRFAYILVGILYAFLGLIVGFIPAIIAGILFGDKWFDITYLSVIGITGIAGLYMIYKGLRGFIDKDYYNNVLLKQSAKQTLKHLRIPKTVEELSSWLNQKGSNFEYSKVKDFLQNGDLYIANFKVSNETKEIVNNKLVSQAEKVEIRVEPSELTKTALVIGRMGSGKSVFLKNIYAQRIYNRAVINDVKGEYVEAFYDAERDIIYNPFDRRTHLWDLFSDIKRNPALASVVSESIVLSISKEKDFWLSSASKLLEEAILSASFNDLIQNKYKAVIQHVEAFKQNAVENNDKTALSVYATLQPVLDIFMLLAYLESKNYKKFSIYDFANSNQQKTIFLLLDPAHSKSVQPFTNALLSVLISVLLSKPDTKSDFTLFLLDEFLNIQIPEAVLIPLFTTSRSKGIQLVLASQYLPQDTHSNKLTQLILNSRHILALFKITEPSTLELIKKNFGEIESVYSETNTSISFNTSESKEKRKSIFSIPNINSSESYGMNTQEQLKRERKLILDELKILNLPEHHFIYVQASPLLICLAKIEKFFFEDKKKNSYFEEIDLSDFYRERFTITQQPPEPSKDKSDTTTEIEANKKFIDI